MEKYLSSIETIFKANNYSYLNNSNKEQKMLCLYSYYHYYKADNSMIGDLISSVTYDSGSDDNIDGIFIDNDADDATVDIICSYQTNNGIITFIELENIYKKMLSFSTEALYGNKNSRPEVRNILCSDDEYKFGENYKKLNLKIILDLAPKYPEKRKYINFVDKISLTKYTTCSIIFQQDIEQEVLEIESPKEYVDNGVIFIDRSNNYLSYGKEQSIVVNVSANSIKKLYFEYGAQGLFGQNLRYYIKNAKTDSKIVNSIINFSENFWYYNNGIIIICDSYTIQDRVINLSNFSIINGGQTTKLIGDTDYIEDFYVQCKIIRNKFIKDIKEKNRFISDVAEASNTQKPIKPKDLVANRVEQRQLKTEMSNVGVYVQIKRGSVVNKKVYPNPWQSLTNEEMAQLIYSFIYQCPCGARNNKSSLMSNDEKYRLIFGKDYNPLLLKDLCYLKAYYKLWQKHCEDKDYYGDELMPNLLKNGMMVMIAIVGAILKGYYNKDYILLRNKCYDINSRFELVSQYDITHRIFNCNDVELKSALFNFFKYCYINYYKPGYIDAKEDNSSLIYSNFTKTEKSYKKYILKPIIKEFDKILPSEIIEILHEQTNEDIDNNNEMLATYINNSKKKEYDKDDLVDEEQDLFDKLKSYRKFKYTQEKIKAYEVFLDKSIISVIKFRPKNIIELTDLNVLNDSQLLKYGQDIIDIVNNKFVPFNK